MSTDVIFNGLPFSDEHKALLKWKADTPGLHDFEPDFRRLQLERWIWDHRDLLAGRVMDVGAEDGPRRWIGPGYFTLGESPSCDVVGDLLHLEDEDESVDAILCTEVLEHVTDPQHAVREMARVVRRGGIVLASSPFLWPWHGIPGRYRDYWRFTHEGWRQMFQGWSRVEITAPKWTPAGAALIDILRQYEGMGWRQYWEANTGYFVEAVK